MDTTSVISEDTATADHAAYLLESSLSSASTALLPAGWRQFPLHIRRFLFDALARTWLAQVEHHSNLFKRIEHPIYRAIVHNGDAFAPVLMELVLAGHLEWSPALTEVTGFDPTAQGGASGGEQIRAAWADWLERHPAAIQFRD